MTHTRPRCLPDREDELHADLLADAEPQTLNLPGNRPPCHARLRRINPRAAPDGRGPHSTRIGFYRRMSFIIEIKISSNGNGAEQVPDPLEPPYERRRLLPLSGSLPSLVGLNAPFWSRHGRRTRSQRSCCKSAGDLAQFDGPHWLHPLTLK